MNNIMELDKIITSEDIITVFQPIVCLKDGEIIGYEALSRGPENSPLHNPEKLFETAEASNRIWDLESLCRKKAIEKSGNMSKDKFLFLNVDPMIFKDEKFRKGFTKEFLSKHNMSPDTIIFEITERTAIEDYKSFRTALDNYVNQGYKIAIDDTGAGYSGLKTLSKTKPHYIKIDMDIVRDIDKDSFKQALMKTFVTLSEATNMKLIAEGIETEEELSTLIDMGVYAGQGFFLQRPAGAFLHIPEEIKNLIVKLNKPVKQYDYYNNFIGNIARRDNVFTASTLCRDLKKYLQDKNITGACIVNNDYPIGLVMEHSLNSVLATQYGVSVFYKRPVSLVMDTNPLIIDYYTSVSDSAKLAMSRDHERLYDYVIVTRDSGYYGIVTIKSLLEYTTMLERNYAMELNPLSGLPGNAIIEKVLNGVLKSEDECCVIYIDLDNFKVYNDMYGFENGDKILKFAASLIQNKVKYHFHYNSFVGHIGGDDFVCVIENSLDKCRSFCDDLLQEFNKGILDFYNERDKNNGFIEALDRKGNRDRFNLTSLSISGIYGDFNNFETAQDIAKTTSAIKKQVKKSGGNRFCIIENEACLKSDII